MILAVKNDFVLLSLTITSSSRSIVSDHFLTVFRNFIIANCVNLVFFLICINFKLQLTNFLSTCSFYDLFYAAVVDAKHHKFSILLTIIIYILAFKVDVLLEKMQQIELSIQFLVSCNLLLL